MGEAFISAAVGGKIIKETFDYTSSPIRLTSNNRPQTVQLPSSIAELHAVMLTVDGNTGGDGSSSVMPLETKLFVSSQSLLNNEISVIETNNPYLVMKITHTNGSYSIEFTAKNLAASSDRYMAVHTIVLGGE